MIILSKFKMHLVAFWGSLLSMFFMVLGESTMIISLAYGMLILHIFSGWVVMWKYREAWDQEKWFKACMKFLWFAVLILATKAMKKVYEIDLPIAIFVAGLLTVNEFRGLVGNAGRLMGIDLWTEIADQVDWHKLFGRIKKHKD